MRKLPGAGLLGAAVAVLPAVAGSEPTPTIQAVNIGGGAYPEHRWSPATAEVSAGGGMIFQNMSASTPHGVVWTSAEAPSCTGVPLNKGETSWKGTCTFTHAGVYTFHCYVHPTEMTGSITVTASGTTTMTTTTGTTTQTTTGGGGSSTTTSTSTVPGSGAAGSPLAGSASQAIKLPSNQHGKAVHGSVAISQAGAGGRLEVDLLAKSASLASAGQPAQVRVGKLVRSQLPAGRTSFSVPLNSRARSALHRHHRLGLSVKLVITPASGSAVIITRRVVVHS